MPSSKPKQSKKSKPGKENKPVQEYPIPASIKPLIEKNTLFHAYILFSQSQEHLNHTANAIGQALQKTPNHALHDFLIIEPSETGSIGINEIRVLQNFIYQKPSLSLRRTAVIPFAQRLTNEAQSALLKILEEPPQSALILLLANNPESLIKTIISRTHSIYLPAPQAGGENGDKNTDNDFINNILLDLAKTTPHNISNAKEIMRYITAAAQFNVNKPLMTRVIKNLARNLKTKTWKTD